jgi:hypothetical protein
MQRRRVRAGIALIGLTLCLAACGGGGGAAALPTGPPLATSAPPVSPSSPSASVDPASLPRMDGTYAVEKTVTAKRNFASVKLGDVLRRLYRIRPLCPIGPCDAFIKINLGETNQNISRRLSYDRETDTYSLVPVPSPVVCTGVDGRRYRLHTTDRIVITPKASEPTPVDVVVTRWTGTEIVQAVPKGRAVSKGRCRPATVRYAFVGTLR